MAIHFVRKLSLSAAAMLLAAAPLAAVDSASAASSSGNAHGHSKAGVAAASVTAAAVLPGPTDAGAFVSLPPTRILDTRPAPSGPIGQTTTGPVTGGSPVSSTSGIDLVVLGHGGVPATNVSAVVLNVTVINPSVQGWLSVYPGGTAAPTSSSLDFWGGQTIANLVTVKVGANGDVNLLPATWPWPSVTTDLAVDVAGYYIGGGAPTAPGTFASLDPSRILDTRQGTGHTGLDSNGARIPAAQVTSASPLGLKVLGQGNIPASNVSAVVLNVTVVGASDSGWLTAYPGDVAEPTASNINFVPDRNIANAVTVKPGATNGDVKIALATYPNPSVSADVVVDVAGYYVGGTPVDLGTFVPLSPERLFDTRCSTASAAGCAAVNLTNGSPMDSTVDQAVPAVGTIGGLADVLPKADSVVMNTTVTAPSTWGWATVYPADLPQAPNASNLNFGAGETIANLGIVQLANGFLALDLGTYPAPSVFAHLIGDVAGFFIGHDWHFSAGAPATNSGNAVASISCFSSSFCAAGGAAGTVSTFNGSTWTTPTILDTTAIHLSCASSTFCVAVNSATSPFYWVYNGTIWSGPLPTGVQNPVGPLTAISCPSTTFCMAVAGAGTGGVSYATFNGTSWTQNPASPTVGVASNAMTCASASFCVLGNASDTVRTFNGSSWSAETQLPNATPAQLGAVNAAACEDTTHCLIAGNGWLYGYNVVTGTFGGPFGTGQADITAASCASALCGLTDAFGYFSPTVGVAVKLTNIVGGLTALSCPTSTFCAAVDNGGMAYTGTYS